MGDNVFLGDRNGVRTPMQWSADRNAGFSRANPQRLILPVNIDPEYHYESLNVEAQQQNPNSLLWWSKRLVALRKRFQAFGLCSIELLSPDNPHSLAFIRRHEDETVLVVANLSRRVQYVELNLAPHKGRAPLELFGQTKFPAIGELPYLLTLGAHEFYWFSLEEPKAAADVAREAAYQPPAVEAPAGMEAAAADRALLEQVLPGYIEGRRWFAGRDRDMSGVRVLDVLPLGGVHFAVARVEFTLGEPEDYVVPLAVETGDRIPLLRERSPQAVIAHLRAPGRTDEPTAVLLDPSADAPWSAVLLDALRERARGKGTLGPVWADLRQEVAAGSLEPRLPRSDHRRASVAYGEHLLLKLYRRLGEGVSPELELNRCLSQRAPEALVPPLLGAVEYRPGRSEPITLATLHGWVRNEGTAWEWARDELRRFYERALASGPDVRPPPRPAGAPLLERRLTARRCRIHGHYHLGKLLYTGKDFTVLDFEGDSSRPLAERRRKRSALRDVAAMVRSFEYAAQTALRDAAIVREADRAAAEPWARLWMTWAPAAFLGAYLEATKGSPIVPRERAETEMLLDTLNLELALDDVHVELDRRPDWAMFALRSLEDTLA